MTADSGVRITIIPGYATHSGMTDGTGTPGGQVSDRGEVGAGDRITDRGDLGDPIPGGPVIVLGDRIILGVLIIPGDRFTSEPIQQAVLQICHATRCVPHSDRHHQAVPGLPRAVPVQPLT